MRDLITKEVETSLRNSTGLDKQKSEEMANDLNILLAEYSVFYQNVRGYHWNIKGKEFFELHIKFEELYGNLYLKIDEIAERIVTLGFVADYNFSDYLENSKIVESPHISDGTAAAKDILNSLNFLISAQRDVLASSREMNDQGTYLLMSGYIIEQEKLSWMYAAYLEK